MATYTFRTYVQSNGPETFDGGIQALDVIHIPWSEVTKTFSGIAAGDTLNIRQHSGLRQYVPELTKLYWDANFTAGEVAVVIDGTTIIAAPPITSSTAGIAKPGGGQLSAPVNKTFTLGIGILTTATYYYRVSALDGVGETLASTETSLAVTGPVGVNVNWGLVAGASGGYNIYGNTTGGELFMGTVAEGIATFLDDGTITPSGALPGANTTATSDTAALTVMSTVTPDAGSVISLFFNVLPVGSTGNLYIQLATRPAQS